MSVFSRAVRALWRVNTSPLPESFLPRRLSRDGKFSPFRRSETGSNDPSFLCAPRQTVRPGSARSEF